MPKPTPVVNVVVRVNRLPAIGSAARGRVAAAVGAAVGRAAKRAQAAAPVDTGYHRSKIEARHEPGALEGAVYAGADYALYLERGTRTRVARPHVGPAAEAERDALTADVGKAFAP